jgi:hypothetical protein
MHPDDEFLRDYYKDAREEMNWRREVEWRLLQFLLIFYPVIGTVMVTLYQTAIVSQVYWLLAIGAVIFIVAASLFITDRVRNEHKSYADIGFIIQKIWTYFGLFETGAYLKDDVILAEILRDPQKGFGKGQGYKKTIILIWVITSSMLMLILALAGLKTP